MSDQFQKLKLTEEEKKGKVKVEEDDLEDVKKDFQITVGCKLLTSKTIIVEFFRMTMPKIWGLVGNVQIEKAGINVFICKFKNRKDKLRIVEGGPWIYDKALLVFDELKGSCCPTSLEFRYAKFWFHFHKLPYVFFNRKYVEALANSVGEFEKVDTDENGRQWGETLRVRVKIDTSKPLRRGAQLFVGTTEEAKWIPITIEKLPDFYYGCGRMGHVQKDCDEEEEDNTQKAQYGSWLREESVTRT